MRYLTRFASLLAVGLLMAISMSSAHAQATRTWVSGVGDDANPCDRTAPCKTFAGAISKTAASGEINCLDPGGFGAVTITKSISIICGEVGTGGVLVSGTNGIVVNAGLNDTVLLEGLDIEGLGTGLNGVQIVGSGRVTVRKCSIRHFTGNGVNLVGIAGARAVVVDSIILDNAIGFNIQGSGGAVNRGVLLSSTIDSNSTGVQVSAPSNLIMASSTITGTSAAVNVLGGAAFTSFGNNAIGGAGTPTSTIPLR